MTKHIKIEVTSDTLCPYCYLAYKRLTSAISQANSTSLPDVTFSLRFLPFQLNASLPKSPGLDKTESYLSMLENSAERWEEVKTTLGAKGAKEGIAFNFGGRKSNTLDSHRLLEWVWQEKGGEAHQKVAESLFEYYFEQEGDLGDWEGLARRAEGVNMGINKDEVIKFLETDELIEETDQRCKDARSAGITSVPYIVINDEFVLTDVQDSATFLQAFERIGRGERI